MSAVIAALAAAPVHAGVGCLTSSGTWQSQTVPAETGAFTCTFDATPAVPKLTAITALSDHDGPGEDDYAMLIRFNAGGTIDVRNGNAWDAENVVPYGAGEQFGFRVEADVETHTYSVFVTLPDASEIILACRYDFNAPQIGITSIDRWAVWAAVPEFHDTCNVVIDSGAGRPLAVPSVYATIQDAIDAAVSGDVIEIAAGTYHEALDLGGKLVTLTSASATQPVIDASGLGTSAVTCATCEGEATRLLNLAITGGEAGGLYFDDSAPVVGLCLITGNGASLPPAFGPPPADGGGALIDSDAIILQTTFTDNEATGMGGGLRISGGAPGLQDVTFTQNIASHGGAVALDHTQATFNRCDFRANLARDAGGAVYNTGIGPGGPTLIANSLLNTNGSGTERGGAVHNANGSLTLLNCTIVGNRFDDDATTGLAGGGVYGLGSVTVVANCIVWENTGPTAVTEDEQIAGFGNFVDYSCVEGLSGALDGVGNIGDHPIFVDADGADDVAGTADDVLSIYYGSPCIDAGDTAVVPVEATDYALGARLVDDPTVIDTGAGGPPVVDIGAYELQPPDIGSDGDRLWVDPGGGAWTTNANWSPADAPGVNDTAIFFLPNAYGVTHEAKLNVAALQVARGHVTFPSADLAVTGALWVGGLAGTTPTLTVAGGVLEAGTVRVGLDDDGDFELQDGAALVVTDAVTGAVTIERGRLSGGGVIDGPVVNLDRLRPFLGGALQFTDTFAQRGALTSGRAAAGTLEIQIQDDGEGSPEAAQLILGGSGSTLGGGLEVEIIDDVDLPPGTELDIVIGAGDITQPFDAAFLPGFTDRFVKVVYPALPLVGPAPIVTLEVDPLAAMVTFASSSAVTVPFAGEPTDSVVDDFNGDGRDDVAVTLGAPADLVVIFLSDGLGGFSSVTDIPVGPDPSAIDSGRFVLPAALVGGDKRDLAVSNRGNDMITILENDGTGAFTPGKSISFGNAAIDDQPADLAAAQLDTMFSELDDLVVVNAGSHTITVLLSDGTGDFVELDAVVTHAPPDSVRPGELDNPKDADTEVVVGFSSSGELNFYDNDGAGALTAAGDPVRVGDGPVDLVLADLDADGDLDVATANAGDGTYSVVYNQGSLSFDPGLGPMVGDAVISITTVDLTDDGFEDLALVAEDQTKGTNAVLMIQNNTSAGGGFATEPMNLDEDPTTVLVDSGDVDGDGDEDLITISSGAGSPFAGSAGGGLGAPTTPAATVHENRAIVCESDFDGSGSVGFADLTALLNNWGPCPPACPWDLDGSGSVGFSDLTTLLINWGPCAS